MAPNIIKTTTMTTPDEKESLQHHHLPSLKSIACDADNYKHPQRFWVDYIIEANSEDHAKELTRELCLEQTVELPGQTDAVKEVEAYTVGTMERFEHLVEDHNHHSHLYRVSVAYPNDTAGEELPQFLNVVFGNTSLKKGISVENVTLSSHLSENTTMFPGPKYGIQGLRELVGVPQAPLLMTALKPMGRSATEFADMAYALAKGGLDIIKDDHGLSNQVWAPFEERVQLCSEAVLRANKETGRKCLYAPCLNAPSDQLVKRAYFAKDCGAGAVMILPGLAGWDVVRQLAAAPTFGLPILIHPAMLGGWLQSHPSDQNEEDEHPHGLSHQFLFGVLPRLCGADAVIFANAGGRFQFTSRECQKVAEGCRRPMGRFEAVFPSPAGGMKLNRVGEMRKTFGDDTLFLIGGGLLEVGPDLEEDAKIFAHCAGRDKPYCPPGRDTTANIDESNPLPPENDPNKKLVATNRMTEKLMGHDMKVDSTIPPVPSISQVEAIATAVRRRVLEYTLKNNGGYLSQACSSAETLATLYLRALRLGPSIAPSVPGPFRGSPGPGVETKTGEGYNGDFTDPDLDRLIFSPVHYALVLYSLLVEIGRLDIKAFESYNKDGSTVELIGAEHSPGHAVTAGSLAQALSQAAGIAYARKLKGHTGRVVVYMSDGEFQEGQTWEAVQAMVFHKIELTAVVDVNGQQCDGKMEDVCDVGSLARKLKAFGATVKEVDGHNVWDIEKAVKGHTVLCPTFVLCYTNPCQGFPLLKNRAPKLHYVRFKNSSEKQQWEDVLAKMDSAKKWQEDEEDGNNNSQLDRKGKLTETEIDPHEKSATIQDNTMELGRSSEGSLIEKVTRPHRAHLLEWMKMHPRTLVLTADLTSSCEADQIRDSLPNQYLSLGMAEQNMMSFAGGLAREGYRPYIHTFGVFVTRRPFDQVAMSIGVPNLPVRLLGFLPGVTTPGGVTHQAIDDIALMRSIPNMRILEVGDATEVESVLDVAEAINGPVYIRMLRGEVPRLFPKSCPMKLGVVRLLSEGSDIALITTGICTEESIKARNMIKSSDVSILHLHLTTIVPFPSDVVVKAANTTKHGVITMENHSVVGGVGSATAEVLSEHAVGKPLVRLGVQGIYAHGASREYLVKECGFDAYALIGAMERLVNKKLISVNESEAQRSVDQEGKRTKAAEKTASLMEERPEDL